jgi:hypothetical protein
VTPDDPLLAELIDFETFPRGADWITGQRRLLSDRLA